MKRKLVLSILMVLACGMLAGCDSKKTSPDNGESISTQQESSANGTSSDNGLS